MGKHRVQCPLLSDGETEAPRLQQVSGRARTQPQVSQQPRCQAGVMVLLPVSFLPVRPHLSGGASLP